MAQFPAVIDLSTLSGSAGANPGVRLDGIDTEDQSGHSVASAGDLNGDGFADVIVGAYGGDPDGGPENGLPSTRPATCSSRQPATNWKVMAKEL